MALGAREMRVLGLLRCEITWKFPRKLATVGGECWGGGECLQAVEALWPVLPLPRWSRSGPPLSSPSAPTTPWALWGVHRCSVPLLLEGQTAAIVSFHLAATKLLPSFFQLQKVKISRE